MLDRRTHRPSSRLSASPLSPTNAVMESPRGGLGGLSRTAARRRLAEVLAGPGARPKRDSENSANKFARLFAAGSFDKFIVLLLAVGFATRGSMAAEVATEPYEWKSVTIGGNGFINGIVYGRAADAPCYINTDMGGAYRLDAAKNQWVCLTDWIKHDDWSLNQMGVETLAVDPTDPSRVYAGVGTYMGASAVVRSSDQGRTWQRTNVPFAMNGNGPGRNSGQRMTVDPNQPARLLYGTRTKGLWESVDHGATWGNIASFPTTGESTKPAKETGVVWTLFDQASGKPGEATPVAYAGVCTTQADKIFRTLDGGKTWQGIPGQPGGPMMATRAALTPDGNTLFATFVTSVTSSGPWGIEGGAVYRCDHPAGDRPVWTDITPDYKGGGWSGFCLDPQSPTTLYVSTIDHYAAPGDDIFRSRNNGKTWSPLQSGRHRDDRSAPYVKDAKIHWTGDVQVNPRNASEAMFTTGYGLYRTTNLSDAEPTWTFYNAGFEQSAVLELISPQAGAAHLLSAIGDRDGYRHEDFSVSPKFGRFGQKNDAGQTDNLSMGTCNDVDVAADGLAAVRVGNGVQVSGDGGVTWKRLPDQPVGNAAPGQPLRMTGGHVAIAADGSSIVWTPGNRPGVVATRNADGWGEWTPCVGLPNGAHITGDSVDAKTFYACGAGAFFVSTDGGRTFAKRNGTVANGVPDRPIKFRATHGKAGDVWLIAGENDHGQLWHTTDGGATWTRAAPDVITVVKQVGLGAPPPGKTYPAVFIGGTCGDVRGFFRSDDAGDTWVRINDDQHQYGNVTVIAGDPRVFGRLYVGTNGRGIVYATPANATRR